jgi:hypothetical protein
MKSGRDVWDAGREVSRLARLLAFAQGFYYGLTGLWAIVHRDSFEAVTGPKVDYWLVVTVSLQICAVAAALLVAAVGNQISTGIRVLGLASAFGFVVVDTVYPLLGRISLIYMGDAVPQAVFVVIWLFVFKRREAHGANRRQESHCPRGA